jgi:hypothetical protein
MIVCCQMRPPRTHVQSGSVEAVPPYAIGIIGPARAFARLRGISRLRQRLTRFVGAGEQAASDRGGDGRCYPAEQERRDGFHQVVLVLSIWVRKGSAVGADNW